jgi:outer membrane protein assembly factor BamB
VTRYCIAAAVLVLTSVALRGENWPAWRGPGGGGVSTEKDLPLHWSATENVRWKAPVPGAGVSTPIVWGERVFLTSSDGRDNDRLHLLCFHRDTGKLLWHNRYFGSAVSEGQFPPGGMAVPTPTTDGERVYALFGTGDLVCVDLAGRPVWVRSLAQEYGPFRNRWGMAASPLLVGDLLVVQVDHWGKSYLLAVERGSGATRWRTVRDASVNWTSPVAVQVQGRTQIVAAGTYTLKGYDAETGKELWTAQGLQMQCIPTPVGQDGKLYAVSGRDFYTLALKLDGKTGDLTGTNVVWKVRSGGAYVPSPLCLGERYWFIEDSGWLNCLDAATGKKIYRERLGGKVSASPVAGAGRLYLTAEDGHVTVIDAAGPFKVLARNDVGETLVASPALSQGRIFLRGDKHLWCIGEK